jgi:O-antigen/teichoic acid export membrane protein
VGNLLSRGVGLILIPLYTGKFEHTAQFNYWESLILASTLLSMVSAHGITAALMWTLKTGGRGGGGELTGEAQQRAVSAAMGWVLLSAGVFCGGAALAAEPFAAGVLNTTGYATPLALLMLSQGLRVATYPAEGVLKLRFQTVPVLLMSFGEFLIQVVGTVLALVVFETGLEGMAWAALAAAMVRFVLGLIWLPEMRKPRIDWPTVAPMVSYGLPLMPGAVASMVLSLSDRWFFNFFGMAGDGGLYAFGDKWARLVEMVLITPLVAMWPAVYFNMAKDDDAPKQFGRVATLWVGLGGLFAFGLTMAGPALTALFDTSDGDLYAGAAAAIGVLTAGYVVLGLVEVARVGFAITGRTRRTGFAMVVAAGANIGLNAWLIPQLGMMGAAWATLLSYVLALLLVLYLSRHVYPQEWEWGRLAWAGGVLVAAAWSVDAFGPPAGTVPGASLRLGALLAVPAFLLATGFLTAEERAAGGALLRSLPGRLKDRFRKGG